MPTWMPVATCVVLCLGLGSACGGSDDGADELPDGLRVGAFDFAESELLAELYAQAVEGRGVPIERLGSIGPREIVAPALQLDQVDLVPEYVGTAAAHFGAAGQDLDALRATLEPLELTALTPAAAEDANVFVVTEDTADEHGLTRISDLSELAPTARFGGPVECPERPLCLLGLRDTYGLSFAEFVPQRSLTVTADALVRGEIDVGLMFSTSAELSDGPFVVLDDDRQLQPAENVVPVVRQSALTRWGPEVRAAVDAVSAALTTADLQSLNRRVADGEAIDQVAAGWLAALPLAGG